MANTSLSCSMPPPSSTRADDVTSVLPAAPAPTSSTNNAALPPTPPAPEEIMSREPPRSSAAAAAPVCMPPPLVSTSENVVSLRPQGANLEALKAAQAKALAEIDQILKETDVEVPFDSPLFAHQQAAARARVVRLKAGLDALQGLQADLDKEPGAAAWARVNQLAVQELRGVEAKLAWKVNPSPATGRALLCVTEDAFARAAGGGGERQTFFAGLEQWHNTNLGDIASLTTLPKAPEAVHDLARLSLEMATVADLVADPAHHNRARIALALAEEAITRALKDAPENALAERLSEVVFARASLGRGDDADFDRALACYTRAASPADPKIVQRLETAACFGKLGARGRRLAEAPEEMRPGMAADLAAVADRRLAVLTERLKNAGPEETQRLRYEQSQILLVECNAFQEAGDVARASELMSELQSRFADMPLPEVAPGLGALAAQAAVNFGKLSWSKRIACVALGLVVAYAAWEIAAVSVVVAETGAATGAAASGGMMFKSLIAGGAATLMQLWWANAGQLQALRGVMQSGLQPSDMALAAALIDLALSLVPSLGGVSAELKAGSGIIAKAVQGAHAAGDLSTIRAMIRYVAQHGNLEQLKRISQLVGDAIAQKRSAAVLEEGVAEIYREAAGKAGRGSAVFLKGLPGAAKAAPQKAALALVGKDVKREVARIVAKSAEVAQFFANNDVPAELEPGIKAALREALAGLAALKDAPAAAQEEILDGFRRKVIALYDEAEAAAGGAGILHASGSRWTSEEAYDLAKHLAKEGLGVDVSAAAAPSAAPEAVNLMLIDECFRSYSLALRSKIEHVVLAAYARLGDGPLDPRSIEVFVHIRTELAQIIGKDPGENAINLLKDLKGWPRAAGEWFVGLN